MKEKVGYKIHKNVREEEVAARKRKAKCLVTGENKEKKAGRGESERRNLEESRMLETEERNDW
jgi:hypothetical protein